MNSVICLQIYFSSKNILTKSEVLAEILINLEWEIRNFRINEKYTIKLYFDDSSDKVQNLKTMAHTGKIPLINFSE